MLRLHALSASPKRHRGDRAEDLWPRLPLARERRTEDPQSSRDGSVGWKPTNRFGYPGLRLFEHLGGNVLLAGAGGLGDVADPCVHQAVAADNFKRDRSNPAARCVALMVSSPVP
jgi:hypothetical protein